MKHNPILIGAIALLAGTQNTFAQNTDSKFSAGVGLIHLGDHYIGDNDETLLVPLINYQNDRLKIGVLEGASYDFYRADKLTVKSMVKPRYTNLDGPDARELRGIDRRATIDFGLGLDYGFGQNYVSASIVTEITGEHDGSEVDVQLGRVSAIGDTTISYAIGSKWQSAKLSNYMFGVSNAESTASRPAFKPKAGHSPYAMLLAEYRLTDNWDVLAGAEVSWLTGDAKDSPLVQDDSSFAVFSGIVRKF